MVLLVFILCCLSNDTLLYYNYNHSSIIPTTSVLSFAQEETKNVSNVDVVAAAASLLLLLMLTKVVLLPSALIVLITPYTSLTTRVLRNRISRCVVDVDHYSHPCWFVLLVIWYLQSKKFNKLLVQDTHLCSRKSSVLIKDACERPFLKLTQTPNYKELAECVMK